MYFSLTNGGYTLSLSLFWRTHTVLHGYQLCQGEQAVSLTSCTLGESADTRNTFYVVGTAFVDVGEKEPTQGRVMVFQVTDSKHDKMAKIKYSSACVCGGGGGGRGRGEGRMEGSG